MRLPIAVVIVVAATTSTGAQVRVVRHDDDRLTGITTMDVVVNDVNGQADSCRVLQTALQEAAVATLRAAGIKASVSGKASSWFHTIYVSAESAASADRCVTSVAAELVAQVEGIPETDRYAAPGAWGSLLVGQMPLVRRSVLVGSTRADHASRVDAAVRDHVNAIGARVKAVNSAR